MHEQLRHLGTMQLVRRPGQLELHGAEDPPGVARDEHVPRPLADAGRDLVHPETACLVDRERDDEAHAGAVVDDRVEDIGEHVEVGLDARTPVLDRDAAQRVRASAHRRTIATR
jgi:hypothetical protein